MILSSVDEVINRARAVIEQLQVVKRGLMEELLTRGLPGRHERFRPTTLGRVPEGWEVASLGDLAERMFVGIAQAATHAYVDRRGVPIVRTANLRDNRIDETRLLRVSSAFAQQMHGKSLRVGDVLSARTGQPGKSAMVPESLDGAQCFSLLVTRPGPRLHGHTCAM